MMLPMHFPALDMDHSTLGMHRQDMPKSESIGERIRRLREARGMQQVDLADAIGARPHAMWRYESGGVVPGAERLAQIASVLGTTSQYLLRGEEEESGPRESHVVPIEPKISERTQRLLDEYLATPRGQALRPEVRELLIQTAGRAGDAQDVRALDQLAGVLEMGFRQRSEEGEPTDDDLGGYIRVTSKKSKRRQR